jgi:hypothetical protein
MAFLLSTTAAHAYVDPGSGSVIITTVLGVLAAIGYTLRKHFYRLKRLVSGNKPDDNTKSDG